MQISFLIGAILAAPFITAHPTRLHKRIAQVITDSTQAWEKACDAAGGGTQCNPVSVAAFGTLLAAAGPCDQQNAADNMIDLAKTLNSDAKMIQLAQIFAQQARNSPDSLSIPYCQQAPRNAELNGLFQCQFDGVNPTTFVGNIQIGAPGTIPVGHSSPINPPKSCPANPQGGIADGTQLVDVTQNPGVGASKGQSAATSTSVVPPSPTGQPMAKDAGGSPASSSTPSSSGGFQQQNKLDAQKLNKQFEALTADSSCTDGQNACIRGQFAQCVGGMYTMNSCGSALMCVALPLVNSPGTSITCDTQSDAEARIGGSITGA